jgi:quercetin dioxygenase-like cupin family protein
MRAILATSISASMLLCLSAPAAWAEAGGHQMVKAEELEWVEPASFPAGARMTVIEGALDAPEPFTARISFPAGYELPAHTHPAVERVTVLKGTAYIGLGDELDRGAGMPLEPSDMMIIQPGHAHFLYTEDEEVIVQLNGIGPWGITYVNSADDPRKAR